MKLLKPGTGNQRENRKQAIRFIADNIFDTTVYDFTDGTVGDGGNIFKVSAYAETPAAFISTPGSDMTVNSIYASGLNTMMLRQLKNDERIIIYQVDPKNIPAQHNSNSASWDVIQKAADCIWIYRNDQMRMIDRR